MNRRFSAVVGVTAFVLGFFVAPSAAFAEAGAPAAAACSAAPDRGWVLFYEHSNCQGRYQGWTTCGRHYFTGAMKMQASSYWDNQTGKANTDVTDDLGHLAFTTIARTGIRNVSKDENDRSYAAWLNC